MLGERPRKSDLGVDDMMGAVSVYMNDEECGSETVMFKKAKALLPPQGRLAQTYV